MEDFVCKLTHAGDPPRVYILSTESIEDITTYVDHGWKVYIRQSVQTVTPFENKHVPKGAVFVTKVPPDVDVMHLVAPAATTQNLMEARQCRARIVRVGGTGLQPRFSAYAEGLRKAAMTLRSLSYDIHRLKAVQGLPVDLVADDREGTDPSTILAFANPAMVAEAGKLSATMKDIALSVSKTFNPRDMERAQNYIKLLEDALLTLQKRMAQPPADDLNEK